MSIDNIISRLTSATEFKQVAQAGISSTLPQIDTEALLTSMLNPVVNENVFALKLPEKPNFPNIVHMLVGGAGQYYEQHLLTQVDRFIISLRASSVGDLTMVAKRLLSAIIESPYAIEVKDKQKDYEPARECYRLDLDLSFTVPATGVNAETPAVLIYMTGEDAEESDYDNLIKQKVNSGYGVAILTTGNDADALCEVVRKKLLGFQQTPEHYEMQYARGSPLENEGGLRIWREIYQDSYSIKQPA